MALKEKQRQSINLYLAMTGIEWLIYSLHSTVVYVYRATRVTDDPFQLTMIWTVFTVSVLFFEIPTGVVADAYSRRLSVIIGLSLTGVGALIEGIFPVFGAVLLSQFIWGVGYTFISGAKDAWIADEVGEEGMADAYMRGTQIGQIAYLVGIPISTALGAIALNLPIVLSGIMFFLMGAFLAPTMQETKFQRSAVSSGMRANLQRMSDQLGAGFRFVRGRSIMSMILLISTVYGLSSAGFDNLWTVNMLDNVPFPAFVELKPVVWFGIINAVVSVLGVTGTEWVRRRMDVSKQAVTVRALMILSGLTALCMIVFGLAGNFWLAATVYCLSLVFRTMSDPIFRTWINLNTESNVRATILSMDSQLLSLGQAVGGPVIGAIGSTISLPAALVTTGVARLPVAALFARLWLAGKKARTDQSL